MFQIKSIDLKMKKKNSLNKLSGKKLFKGLNPRISLYIKDKVEKLNKQRSSARVNVKERIKFIFYISYDSEISLFCYSVNLYAYLNVKTK